MARDDISPERSARSFDPITTPWFFPLILLIVLIVSRCLFPYLTERPELVWLDQALKFRERFHFAKPLDSSIQFVELSMNDEMARRFATDGEYATNAAILRTLAGMGAKVIAVDIIFAYGREEDQRLLAEAIRDIHAQGQTRVVLSTSLETRADGTRFWLDSLPAVTDEAFDQGVVNVTADDHWREYRLVHQDGKSTRPSLALAAFAATLPPSLAPKVESLGVMSWKSLGPDGKVRLATADDARLFLNLQHSYYTHRYDQEAGIEFRKWTISQAETVAASPEGADALLDTIVFYGYDAEVDGKPTAHHDQDPGMWLHGHALNDLLHRSFIRASPFWLDGIVYLVVAGVAAICFSMIRSQRGLVLVAIAGAILILVSGWASIWLLNLFPFTVTPAMLWGASVVSEMARRWTFEQRERTMRDAMLGFYFSPAVLKQVTQNLDMIRPQSSDVAVMLSDLRGFTNLCESQKVERVFELLNRLFAVETEAALRENGSLARFAGDQFLAYWGAPEPFNDSADRALRAALESQRILTARRQAAGDDDLDSWLRIGVGLHVGKGLVGHVGSRSYRDYNIVGDSVNTTARVEGQTKNYDAPILATGEFMAALIEQPAALMVDCVKMKGKTLPTSLYAILLESSTEAEEGMAAYAHAFQAYQDGKFAEAALLFARLTEHPHQTIRASASLLKERCDLLHREPPVPWDGAYELTSK